MHDFSELIERCTTFTLESLRRAQEKTLDALQISGATSLVKTLQMIRLEKAIFAVGIFSIFEAILQDSLNCKKGFAETEKILRKNGELELLSRFSDLQLAINSLKHGQGRSYDNLVKKDRAVNLNVKPPGQPFFNEGDVSEVNTLIDVDDKFIYSCVEVIKQVFEAIAVD